MFGVKLATGNTEENNRQNIHVPILKELRVRGLLFSL